MSASILPGHLYLIDTSVNARTRNPQVKNIIASLLADRAAATCITVDLEAGYSGRDAKEVEQVAIRRATSYIVLPINESIAQRAREVQMRMANRGHHRAAGAIDLITAAVAEYHNAIVLHYDRDFEHISTVTGQRHVWVAPPGSLN